MKKQVKTNAMRILEKSGINFEAVFYDSDGFMDGVLVAEKLGQDLRDVYKTLVTESKITSILCLSFRWQKNWI